MAAPDGGGSPETERTAGCLGAAGSVAGGVATGTALSPVLEPEPEQEGDPVAVEPQQEAEVEGAEAP